MVFWAILKVLTLFVAILACVVIIKFRERIVRIVGKAEWAEKYLGSGGTYTMWIFIAIFIVLIALVWMVGTPWG